MMSVPNISNILIFNHRHMGDVLMTTPALLAIRNKYKNATIDCITNHTGREVLKEQNLVDNIVLENEPLSKNYDIALLFKATFRNALQSRRLKIPVRIGWRREGNSLLLTHPVKTKSEHHIHQNIDLLAPLDITNISDQMIYKISPSATAPDFSRYMVFNPGASIPSNRWPADHFAKLANLIHTKFPPKIIITGNAADRILADRIIGAVTTKERIYNYCGESTIDSLAKVLQGASAFITGDTGPMHLAIAVKTQNVIALFGPAHERLSGPLPGYGTVLAKDRNGNWRDGNNRFKNIPVSLIKPEDVFERL